MNSFYYVYANLHQMMFTVSMKRTYLYFIFTLSVACSSPKQETATQTPKYSNDDSLLLAEVKSSPASKPLKVKLFNDVAKTQNKLNTVGVGKMRTWRYDGLGWISSTPYYEFGSLGMNDLRNNLALYLESSRKNEIQTMKVKVNIPNMNQKSVALSRYVNTVEKTFRALNEPMPDDLRSALARGKPYKKETSTMSIENKFEDGNYDSWKLVLTSR